MAERGDLVAGAREWLEAAQSELGEGRFRVAYEAARHAAELAAKAMLLEAKGRYPQRHDVSSDVEREGVRPSSVRFQELRKLLSSHTLGTYGFSRTVHRKDARWAVRIAERMVADLGP